jgi:hypothetical protein
VQLGLLIAPRDQLDSGHAGAQRPPAAHMAGEASR